MKNARTIVIAAAAAAIAATSVPPLYGAIVASTDGSLWLGRQFLAPGDFGAYMAYIAQAADGKLLFENPFTTERLAPLVNVLWLAVGRLGGALSLPPVAAFHLSRVLLIPALAVVAWRCVAWFLEDKAERAAAFLLFMFGSGWGLYLAAFLGQPEPGRYDYAWPIDFWVAESNTFLTMLYSPHFIASLLLFLASMALLCRALTGGGVRAAAAGGGAALILFQFHAFHAPTIYAVGAAYLLLLAVRRRRLREAAASYLVFIAVSSPSVAYHFFLTHYDERARALLLSNLTITPGILYVAAGFGAFAVLAPLGAMIARKRPDLRDRREFLAVWAAVQALIIYAPLTFQRRLLEGLQFPLALFAAVAVVAAFRRVARHPRLGTAVAVGAGPMLAAAIFLPSTFSSLVRSVDVYAKNDPPIFYASRAEAGALEWIRSRSPRDAVFLALPEASALIAGWGGRRVYDGHWQLTIDIDRKAAEAAKFFATGGDLPQGAGITHLYVGPKERALGAALDEGRFRPAFRGENVDIYEILR